MYVTIDHTPRHLTALPVAPRPRAAWLGEAPPAADAHKAHGRDYRARAHAALARWEAWTRGRGWLW